MLDIRIMASPKREAMAKRLANILSLSTEQITWDDRPKGGDAMYTARKTWLHAMPEKATHRLVIQDDVIPCDNFVNICEQIIQAHPKAVFALTTFMYSIYAQMEQDTPYFPVTSVFPACAIILPKEYIKPWIEWCDEGNHPESALHDSHMIRLWCEEKYIQVLSTVPQIADHRDDETLLPCVYDDVRRSCMFSQHPEANWASKKIRRFHI